MGDKVFSCAYSHELKRYGIKHGLTNWAAAYATGLLLARRTLTKLGLDKTFTGVEEADGEYKLTEAADDEEGESRRPFKCHLDVGLRKTSTGARVFGAMKGASDGGLYIPHSENRFPGYDVEAKSLDTETLRKYIFGGHVAEYMEALAVCFAIFFFIRLFEVLSSHYFYRMMMKSDSSPNSSSTSTMR